MNILCETKNLILFNNYESTSLLLKPSKEILFKDEFYGDPQCGFIDKNEKWVLVASTILILWNLESMTKLEFDAIKNVYEIRLKSKEIIEVLTDPWSDESAVWELNLKTISVKRIRPFKDYQQSEYTENVVW